MVPIKMADLASFIAAKKNMGISDAICYMYNSEFVAKLYDEKSKWWYLDNETLYELMEQERRNNSQSGLEVFVLFKEKGVLAFLRNHFEVLHTQGDAYILEEIELFLKNRKQK